MPGTGAKNGKMQDRAVETRKRLLDATAKCLVESGFAGTTTREVCRRAGASRGTLLHHFSTREDLVIEAVEHVLARNIAQFEEAMDEIPADDLTLAGLTRHLWERHWTSDTFYAWLELVLASRTDDALNRQVRSMDERWSKKFDAACRSVLGRDPDGLYWLFFLVLNALSIERIRSRPESVEQSLGDLVDLVKFLERFFLRFGEQKQPATPEEQNKED